MLTCLSFGAFVFFPRRDLPEAIDALTRLQVDRFGPLWRDGDR